MNGTRWAHRAWGSRLRVALLLWGAMAALLAAGCSRPQVAAPTDAAKRVADLRDEIRALEFVDRLQVTGEQAGSLVKALEPIAAEGVAAQEQRQELLAELAPLLERKRRSLLEGTATTEVAGQIRELEDKIGDVGAAGGSADDGLVTSLREVLTEEQVAVAAGGLQARIETAEMLDGYRDLPRDDFEKEMSDWVPELAEGSDWTADEVEALFREARSFSEDDYRESRDELIRQLTPLFRPTGMTADYLLLEAFTQAQVFAVLTDKAQAGE